MICRDCQHDIQIGEWPFDCANKGHTLYVRLAVLGKGLTREYAPPMPINPMKGPTVDRMWLNPDGTTREMKRDEWVGRHVPGIDP